MKTSVIRHRVADFLKQYPPFDSISESDLLEVAGSGRVKFHQANEYIFRQGQEKAQVVWTVQQGRIDLVEECMGGEQLRDVLGEGDLLGLDRFLGNGRSMYSARTAGDVILYGADADVFESLVQRYPAVKRYLRAHFSVSSLSGSRRISWLDAEAPPEEFLLARLIVLPVHASHADVRSRLTSAGNRVVALVEESRPVGVMTAADLAAAPVESVRLAARPCSIALAPPVSTRAAVRALITSRCDALAVTADGTLDSALRGILTAEELALFSGHNPVRLIGAIRSAVSPAEIRPLLKQAKRVVLDALAEPHDVDDCARIGTEIATALAEACLAQAHSQVSALGVSPPAVPWCWFMFGAVARGELVEPGFPAVGAAYDDSADGATSEHNEYFDRVTEATLTWLQECRVTGVNSSQPAWSLSYKPLSEWKRLFGETIRNPLGHNLYVRRELFDLVPLAGETSLLDSLRDEIQLQLSEQSVVVALLANDTLAHLPPLTFFRGLVLELDGAQRDSVDIGRSAISPIADAARVFALASGRLSPANTFERLQTAALDFPKGAAIFADAAEAFRIAQYYQTISGSSTIAPLQLGKFDQRLLKTAFSSIQRLLEFTDSTFVGQ